MKRKSNPASSPLELFFLGNPSERPRDFYVVFFCALFYDGADFHTARTRHRRRSPDWLPLNRDFLTMSLEKLLAERND